MTLATIVCPECAPVTIPVGALMSGAELYFSDNKLKTTAGILGGKGGARFAGKGLEALTGRELGQNAARRVDAAGEFVGSKAVKSAYEGIANWANGDVDWGSGSDMDVDWSEPFSSDY